MKNKGLATRLIQNGYNVMPVNSKGEPIKSWKKDGKVVRFTVADATGWDQTFKSQNLAFCPGVNNVAMLDIDVDYKPLANRIRMIIKKRWDSMPIRSCNDPRFACIFQIDDSLMSYSTGRSNVYMLHGEKQQIEYASYNSPMTMYGTHRKTNNPYSWGTKHTPLNTPASDLPILSKDDIIWVFETLYAGIIKANFPSDLWVFYRKYVLRDRLKKKSTVKQLDYSDHEVDKILKNLDGRLRDDWLNAGYALYRQYNGNRTGLAKWDLWSQKFDTYERGACVETWESLGDDGPINLTILKNKSKKERKAPKDLLDAFLENYVLIVKESRIGSLKDMARESVVSIAEARPLHANKQVAIPNVKTGKTDYAPVLKLWLTDPDRKVVHDTLFVPGKPRICSSLERNATKKYWNLYTDPGWEKKDPIKAHVELFKKHVDILFGREGSHCTDWFFTWMGQLIQEPWERHTITPIHISTHTGTGRGWLTRVMIALVGQQNTSDTSIGRMNLEGGKQGYLADSVLCIIPEAREVGKGRYSVSEKMKKQISDLYINVDIKYGTESLQRIVTRFFIQSNHKDALVIDSTERRFNVFMNFAKPQKPEYFQKLYGALKDDQFLTSVYNFLRTYPIDKSKLETMMPTQARTDMINATKSPTALAFLALRDIVDVYTKDILDSFINKFHDVEVLFRLNQDELVHLERNYVIKDSIAILDGKRIKVYFFRESGKSVSDGLKDSENAISSYFSETIKND